MINAFLALVGVGLILIVSEVFWRLAKRSSPESFRKFVHIVTGVYIAFWPLFLSFGWIQILSVVLLVVVFVSKKIQIFKSIHGVKRLTYGEVLFPIGIFLSATFSESGWIYMAAVLHLSLADGLAGLVGVNFLKKFSYKILGQTKTIIGTAVFYMTSLLILSGVLLLDPANYGNNALWIVIALPLLATLIENIAPKGTDNLFVPILIVYVLDSLRLF